ncbi:MAG: shikimate dehydrogenase [Alistipes sp.]|jgi:shikimate dehydrogenase|nr:shikimate dehydrogenase [Alistipes sp.]
MRVYGIIGRPLGHSLSRDYFEAKFDKLGLTDCRFEKFALPGIGAIEGVLAEYGDSLKGFCVTIPYKKEIIARLDSISDEARAIGAVNCVRVREGRLAGFNTDAHGFRVGLEQLLGPGNLVPGHRPRALVLGTGGASCAVRHVLETAGVDYKMVSRTPGPGLITYADLTPEIVNDHKLIVNTTPLGTTPDVEGKPPIPYGAVGPGHFLYDLVYNPPFTAFLAGGARGGAATMNGEAMFRNQAEKNWQIWNGD